MNTTQEGRLQKNYKTEVRILFETFIAIPTINSSNPTLELLLPLLPVTRVSRKAATNDPNNE